MYYSFGDSFALDSWKKIGRSILEGRLGFLSRLLGGVIFD